MDKTSGRDAVQRNGNCPNSLRVSVLARVIHDGSLRNRADASREGRVETREREASSKRDVDRPSGEPARRSSVSTIAVEAFMDNAG